MIAESDLRAAARCIFAAATVAALALAFARLGTWRAFTITLAAARRGLALLARCGIGRTLAAGPAIVAWAAALGARLRGAGRRLRLGIRLAAGTPFALLARLRAVAARWGSGLVLALGRLLTPGAIAARRLARRWFHPGLLVRWPLAAGLARAGCVRPGLARP